MGCEGELAKPVSLSVLSALLVLTVGGIGSAVRAEDTCLPAPTGRTPPGSHWHYRTDPVKQTKCWYLRSQGDAAQPAATGDGADAAVAPASPASPAPKPAKPHQAAKPPGGAKPSAAGAQAPAPAGQLPPAQATSPMQATPTNAAQATQGAAPWPDPQPQAATGNVAWPNPPAVAPSTVTNAAPDTNGTNAPAEPAGQDTGSINPTGASEAPAPAVSPPPPVQTSDVSGSTILVLAAAMAIVGVLMRWLLGKLFARRRKIAAERREPLWVTDEYVMPDALTRGTRRPPGRVDPERLDDEVKQALRKLLRTLERSAA
jgi:hypothetical protein